jgi:plastocyanin
MRYKRIASGALALAALMGGLAACGDDSGDDAKSSDQTDTGAPVELTVKASSSEGKFAFDIPAEISGGVVALTLDNVDDQPHEIALLKVKDGTDPAGVSTWLDQEGAPIPDFFDDAVAGVGNAAPGAQATSTQVIDPGTYVYFCTFGDGDEVHYKNGMLGSVTVTDDKGTGDLPATEASITAEDWTLSAQHLQAGTNAVRFKNLGANQIHHAQLFPLKEGATFDQALADLTSTSDAPPAAIDFEKGTGTMVLAPGQEQVTDLTLQKGSYIMLCFLSDKAGGPPHFLPAEAGGHGMVSQVTVE